MGCLFIRLSGVYEIRSVVNGECFIGGSI